MQGSTQVRRWARVAAITVAGTFASAVGGVSNGAETSVAAVRARIGVDRGIAVVAGLPVEGGAKWLVELANASDLTILFQSADESAVAAVRALADAAGLLGTRVFAGRGASDVIDTADNLVDAVVIAPSAQGVPRSEVLRALHPGGRAVALADDSGDDSGDFVKPAAEGVDFWSHPFHAPDNNPQSLDRTARAPYRTQFLAAPLFSPMPEVTVAAGGRVFKAFGHIAHKANQNAMLETLLCINAYNGVEIWRRPLSAGFMIHRNTMVATPDALWIGDDKACHVIDARTGVERAQIVVPAELADGPVWKWMGLAGGTLYALVGAQEVNVDRQPSKTPGLGHWPWGMWEGHDYKDPRTSFGSGRTLVAIDATTHEVRWSHREEEYVDSRGVAMVDGKIFFYSPEKHLTCVRAADGEVVWRNADHELLAAIGTNGRAQHYVTGYATTTYVKCDAERIYFAGPQRERMVVASTEDGRLLWQRPHGNLQLVLRDEGVWAAGPQETGTILEYATGSPISELPARRACTRATGSIDSVFYRTTGGTVRVDVASRTAKHIAPMRPPCQDGVIISDGLLFWGPWMCGCQLSLYGHIALAPIGDGPRASSDALVRGAGDVRTVAPLSAREHDWPAYRGDNARSSASGVRVPGDVALDWSVDLTPAEMPTAPVTAGGLVFVADRRGIVRAFDARGHERWKAYTGGAVWFPPAVDGGRLFVGSADGRVWAFEAATGRMLWSYRVGPSSRRIPVYGRLVSTWPIAGGVVVEKGMVYAAAGMAHYDGTHVVALDAETGEPEWRNDTSGTLSAVAESGVSVQGEVWIEDGELRFVGGGVYEVARFDLRSGECRNAPRHGVTSQFHTASYALYPEYGRYLSLDHRFDDGRSLRQDASYEGSRFTELALLEPLPAGVEEPPLPVSRWGGRRAPARKALWKDLHGRRFTSFVVTPRTLLAAGHGPNDGDRPFVVAIDVESGADRWSRELPALAVKGGIAVDDDGRIVVALENGRLLAYRGVSTD